MSDDTNSPKIIIDEDWKSKVQAEKEALKQGESSAPSSVTPQAGQHQLPAASLSSLVSMLGTQAMFALGALADPASGKPKPNLAEARHLIDLLHMLEEKTQGNRTPEESSLLAGLLSDLRMAYVTISQQRPMQSS